MPESATKIHLASNLLRSPQLFDGLGATSGGICRDLVMWAAWNGQPVAKLHVPDFCRMMGYERGNLLRRATPEQVEEIRLTGWPEEDIPDFSNVLGLALVRLVSHNFIFPERSKGSKHKRIQGSKIVEHVDVYKVEKSGTRLEFTLSQEILEESRDAYQTINLAEYLSLRTGGGEKRAGGHPDDAARKLYLRLSWKRQIWDYGENAGTIPKEVDPAVDSYRDLVAVAGLQHLGDYSPEKKIASQLRTLLERVGSMPSIRLKPTVTLNKQLGLYEVRWAKMQLGAADAPPPVKYSCAPAPGTWGQAPAPTAPRASKAKYRRQQPSPATAAISATPVRVATAPTRNTTKLKGELTDATTSLRWLESTEGRQTYQDAELHKQHVEDARIRIREIQRELSQPA